MPSMEQSLATAVAPELARVTLSARERASCARVAALMERVRELRGDWDDDIGCDLALGAGLLRDMAAEGFVDRTYSEAEWAELEDDEREGVK